MPENKNALAELAEEMQEDARIMYAHGKTRDRMKKARRIVAELAKVPFSSYCYESMGNAANAILKCRAIAEEGAGDV